MRESFTIYAAEKRRSEWTKDNSRQIFENLSTVIFHPALVESIVDLKESLPPSKIKAR
jgi:hypothetical protein